MTVIYISDFPCDKLRAYEWKYFLMDDDDVGVGRKKNYTKLQIWFRLLHVGELGREAVTQ